MAEPDKDAQKKEIKGLIREVLDEWVADREKTRTENDAKNKTSGGLFGALFS